MRRRTWALFTVTLLLSSLSCLGQWQLGQRAFGASYSNPIVWTAYTSGSSAQAFSLSVPSAVANGMLMYSCSGATGTGSIAMSGFTSLYSARATGGQMLYCFYRIASNEPSSYTVSCAGMSCSGFLIACSHCALDLSGGSPVTGTNSGTTTAATAPSITTAARNDQILWTYYAHGGLSTPPSGILLAAAGTNPSVYFTSQTLPGPTGTNSATAVATGWVAGTVAIMPQ